MFECKQMLKHSNNFGVHVKVRSVHGRCVRVQTLNKQQFATQIQEPIRAAESAGTKMINKWDAIIISWPSAFRSHEYTCDSGVEIICIHPQLLQSIVTSTICPISELLKEQHTHAHATSHRIALVFCLLFKFITRNIDMATRCPFYGTLTDTEANNTCMSMPEVLRIWWIPLVSTHAAQGYFSIVNIVT